MNKPNRKNRPGPPRPQPRGRPVIEGVYNNVHFMHAVASQIGNIVQIQTKSGAIFEGIFYTVSPQFDIVLQLVHRIEVSTLASSNSTSSNNSLNSDTQTHSDECNLPLDTSSIFDVLIFKPTDVVFLKAKDADLDYATKDTFQTDTAISKCNGSRFDEKELEPWLGDAECNSGNGDVDINLELDNNANGWDVHDMFSFNEQRYGVQSTFDQSLSGYTIQIQKKDTQDFRDAEEQAEKIALEIESQPAYKERTDIENGDENEEAKYAAVERPQSSSPDEIKVGKYVAPGRRKQHNTQVGKLIRPSQLPHNANNNSSSSSSSSVPVLASQPPSNNKYSTLVSHSLPTQQSVQKNSAPPQQSGLQPPPIHRIHNQPPLQQVQVSHKLNGDDQSSNEMKHNHHRRHRPDMDSERNERGDRIDRDRVDRIERDSRENRDPRDRDNREREIRENIRDNNKGGLPMPQRGGGMRHYPPPPNQQLVQTGNLPTFSEAISTNNSNSQMLVTSQINQMPPPPHQGPPPHQTQVRLYHNSPMIGQDSQQNLPAHLVMQQQQQVGPPPQPQRQRVQREAEIADFRKFKTNFVLGPSKGPRGNEQNQSSQHQNQPELRPSLEDNANQSKPFSKPYVNPIKQYTSQSSTESPISTMNPDADKRPIPQQQSKTGSTPSNSNTNQLPDAKVEQPAQSYVSVVQQTQAQAQPQQPMHAQKTPVQTQSIGIATAQNQQSSSPPAQQQPIRETERSTPNVPESHQEYQSPPQTSQQISNTSSSSNTPPTSSTPQTPNSAANDSMSSDKSNAPKKYTLNPAAKPFTPRIPVTPNSSRPHTPQTPGTQPNNVITSSVHPNIAPAVAQPNQIPMHPPQQPTPQPPPIPGQHVAPPVMTMAYFVQQQQTYPAPQHAQQAIAYSGASMGIRKSGYERKNQLPVSQVQVAAASAVTGAPLHVATPMAPYISPYPQAHPQTFQGPYAHMVLNRYPETPHQPQPLQYLAATPPSTTPSPGQPHQQQFHQGPQPAGTTQYQAPQQFQVIPVMNGPPVVATPYMQPPNSGPFLLMQPHPQQ